MKRLLLLLERLMTSINIRWTLYAGFAAALILIFRTAVEHYLALNPFSGLFIIGIPLLAGSLAILFIAILMISIKKSVEIDNFIPVILFVLGLVTGSLLNIPPLPRFPLEVYFGAHRGDYEYVAALAVQGQLTTGDCIDSSEPPEGYEHLEGCIVVTQTRLGRISVAFNVTHPDYVGIVFFEDPADVRYSIYCFDEGEVLVEIDANWYLCAYFDEEFAPL